MKSNVKSQDKIKVIHNKFGEITVRLDKEIFCPQGLLGMPDYTSFALANCPMKKFSTFRLFQSLEEDSLVFMVLPIPLNNPIIKTEDLKEALQIAEVNEEDAAFLLISGTKEVNGSKVITVNARVPIIIDTKKQAAMQFILPNQSYDVQHIIS